MTLGASAGRLRRHLLESAGANGSGKKQKDKKQKDTHFIFPDFAIWKSGVKQSGCSFIILDMPPAALADAARQYALNKITLPFGAVEEIRKYFTTAGFAPLRLTTAGKSLQGDRSSGPRAGWIIERVRIIAQRP